MSRGNALVFYGGGLCDCAAFYIAELTESLKKSQLFGTVFVGFYSFRSIVHDMIEEWTPELYERSGNAKGGFFGTCRKTSLTNPVFFTKAIDTCNKYEIKWIFLAGGDGSARQMSEIAEMFHKEGINFVFTMPLTIDGINGGFSLGIQPAVNASLKLIESISSTALRTLNGNQYPGIIYELQGRNRDDILLNVLLQISTLKSAIIDDFENVEIIAIPANLPTDEHKLYERLETISNMQVGPLRGKPVIILLSEGAELKKDDIAQSAKTFRLKLRTFSIGHFSQINNMLTNDEKNTIKRIISKTVQLIADSLPNDEPFTIVFENEYSDPHIADASYYANKNPKNMRLSFEDYGLLSKYELLCKYMA